MAYKAAKEGRHVWCGHRGCFWRSRLNSAAQLLPRSEPKGPRFSSACAGKPGSAAAGSRAFGLALPKGTSLDGHLYGSCADCRCRDRGGLFALFGEEKAGSARGLGIWRWASGPKGGKSLRWRTEIKVV